MRLLLPEKLYTLSRRADFPLYAVGGAVRDALANLPASPDIDLCAPVSAEKFSALAAECGLEVNGVYKNTGTVNLTADGKKIEFTSFRSDTYRRGEHAPASIAFTTDILTDAKRRDFRCNAVYCEIKTEKICDPLGGEADIRARILETTRPAGEVFSEDGLRLMRLARLCPDAGMSGGRPRERRAYRKDLRRAHLCRTSPHPARGREVRAAIRPLRGTENARTYRRFAVHSARTGGG